MWPDRVVGDYKQNDSPGGSGGAVSSCICERAAFALQCLQLANRGTPTHTRAHLGQAANHPSSPRASSTDKKAFCGISTSPKDFIRFLPSFCLFSSFFLRLMSPP